MEDDAPKWPTTAFPYNGPEQHRDPVPFDVRFQLDCGIRPDDLRDELKVLDH